jgi:hypothetical protein
MRRYEVAVTDEVAVIADLSVESRPGRRLAGPECNLCDAGKFVDNTTKK